MAHKAVRIAALALLATSVGVAIALPAQGDPIPRKQSDDPTYGYSSDNPIKVGGGPRNQQAYLRSLRGPAGEVVTFFRQGSCCYFDTPNGLMGRTGLLDKYELTYPGLAKPIVLYLNFYDYEEPRVPVGFTKASRWKTRPR